MKTDRERNDEIMAGQREQAEKEGRCTSTKSFNLRARGTALVVCGKELGHDVTGRDHVRIDELPDGSSITFRWSS